MRGFCKTNWLRIFLAIGNAVESVVKTIKGK